MSFADFNQETQTQGTTLRRTLGMKDLIAYGLAYIAPIAPLTTLGFVWDASGGLIALAYLLGALCMYFTARSYATMTAEVPCSGSVYGFARYSLGELPGFIAGWLLLLDYLLIPALVFLAMSIGLETLLPGVDRVSCLVLLAAVTLAVNWFGVSVTTRVSLISVVMQLVVLLTLLIAAILALQEGKGTGALSLAPLYDAPDFDLSKIITATSICVLSFLGFDAISTLSEEVKSDDRRMVGRAILRVLLICTLLFVGSAWVLGNLMSGVTIEDPSVAIYTLLNTQIGPFSSQALVWIVLIAGFSNVLPMQVGVTRVLYAMGRDSQLPKPLARLHPRHGTPHVALMVSGLLSLAVAIAMHDDFDTLALLVSFGALSSFFLLHVSVLVKLAIQGRSRRLFAHWVVPLLGIAVVLTVLVGMSPSTLTMGSLWLIIGAFYGLYILRPKRTRQYSNLTLPQ
jgi:amino acid transporter